MVPRWAESGGAGSGQGAPARYDDGVTGDPHDHYFTAQPASSAERGTIPVRLAGRDLTVETAGGIFSPGHVDLGTSVLLRSVPPLSVPDGGAVLDLGCGWGPIALTMAFELADTGVADATVWSVDVNERALDLLGRNARRLGLAGVRPVRPDEVPGDVSFAAIWSNPPIRVGKEALHAMLGHWLPRLVVGGSAHLVVGKNLGADSLHAWLTTTFDSRGSQDEGTEPVIAAEVTRVASAKGFRVLEVLRTA